MKKKKLSEELRHCLEGDGCGDCPYHEPETKLTCRGLLRKWRIERMERLTLSNNEIHTDAEIWILKNGNPKELISDDCDEYEYFKKLAEYEDLEEQGKLLKLPCAVGDTVYTNHSIRGWYFREENRPYAAKVVFIGVNGIGYDNCINVDFGNGHMLQFNFSDIGKTVFLTKPEAEAKLKG